MAARSAPLWDPKKSEFLLDSEIYLLSLSARLYQHLDNLAENEIRPVTLGRKNYLFCGNHEAAGNMAVICSLLATCKAHDVNPRLYLNDVIKEMPYMGKASQQELLDMLPHKWKLKHPEAIMAEKQQ
jgi:hypothetical protein